MIYHQRLTKMPVLDIAPVWAKLTRLDASGVYEWLLNPNALAYTVNNNITSLTPLGKNLPNIAPQNSTYQLSLPLLLITPGNNKDLSDDIAILTTFSTMVGQKLPKLAFEFGTFKLPLCCISSLSLTIIQWREGKPTAATGVLGLLVYEEPKPPTIFKEATKPQTQGITPREQTKIADVIRKNEDKYIKIRVNGDYLEGVSKATGKLVKIDSIRNILGVYTVDAPPITRDNIPNIPAPGQVPTP